jgi:hypothetical protein
MVFFRTLKAKARVKKTDDTLQTHLIEHHSLAPSGFNVPILNGPSSMGILPCLQSTQG